MQSKDIITNCKISFRKLRRNGAMLIADINTGSNLSWPTVRKAVDELVLSGVLKKASNNRFIINHKYESFAGIYISKDTIEVSVIDFSGKEIYFDSKKFIDKYSCVETLVQILKFDFADNIKAISICSDDYFDNRSSAVVNKYLWLDNGFMKACIPEETEYYFAKKCVTNSFKWYEDCGTEDDRLNVVFSFFEDNCYYTIVKNGSIIQKRRYAKKAETFYEDVVFPTWKAINPDNMIFIANSEDMFNWITKNISKWNDEIRIQNNIVNQGFEIRETTRLIAVKQKFHPSEGTAIHALYSYYGWTK